MTASHLIAKSVAYFQRIQKITALLFLIAGGISFLFSEQILGYCISSVLAGFSLFLYYQAHEGESPVLDTLKHKPKSIVWVYHHCLVSMPFGVKTFERTTLYIYTLDKQYHTQLIKNDSAEKLLVTLEKELPQATFGFSVEKEQLYRANPAMLLR
ncbi:MAG: hypothetical protein ACPG4Z_02540 [Chitinophagales bacterium]